MNGCELEVPAIGYGQLPPNPEHEIEVRTSSGETSCAYQQGDTSIQRVAHHHSCVPRNGLTRRFCLARTEVIGSGIRRTGIAPDEIRPLANGGRKTFF